MKKTIVLIVLSLLLAGCSKLTMDNYNKIKTGMNYDEVVQILGKPDNCSETLGVRSCQWGDEQRHVQVNFVGDKVLLSYAHNLS